MAEVKAKRDWVRMPDVVEALNPVSDMDEIFLGRLNNIDHMGLQIKINGPGALHGVLLEVMHGILFTHVKVRWNGTISEYRNDPRKVIRVESAPPRPSEQGPSSTELVCCQSFPERDSPDA